MSSASGVKRSIMKDRIFFHRAYKKLPAVPGRSLLRLLLLVGIFDFLIFLFHKELTQRFVSLTADILHQCGVWTEQLSWPFLPVGIKTMPLLDAAYLFPSRQTALYTFIAALLVLLIVPKLYRLPKSLVVYLVFLGLLSGVSAGFFLLWPHRFPYDVADFSLLYMGTQLGMWLLIPAVLAAVLAPLPASFLEKGGVIFLTVGYSILFGAVRYATFLYLLQKISVLHMAAMFFAFGPLIDFVYVVAIYSIYVNLLAVRLQRTPEVWRWLF